METALKSAMGRQKPPSPGGLPRVIPVSIVWNIVVAAASIYLSITIFQVENFANLGDVVKYFMSFLALAPAAIAGFSSVYLLQRKANGRYLTMMLYFVGCVMSTLYLLHLWGVFFSFESIVDGVMRATWVILGVPLAYAVFWVAGKLDLRSRLRAQLEMVSLGIAMLTLIGILLAANVLDGAVSLLNTYSNPLTWAATITAVIFGVLTHQMLHMADYFRETPQQRTAWQGWIMLSPNIIGFSLFFAGPLLLSLYLSFTNSSIGRIPEVIGFSNYATIMSIEFKTLEDVTQNNQSVLSFGYNVLMTLDLGDSRLIIGARDVMFWRSLRNTTLLCLMLVPLSVLPALGLSLILNSKLPGMKFFRAVYFIPSVAAVVGTALIWRWLYDPTIGYFNYTITNIVNFLNGTFGLSLNDPSIQWLTGPGVVLFSVVLLASWQVVGYNTVLFLAGLQGIPKTLYEAAMIDGANRWQQFRNVTVPMLSPTTFFVLITTVVTGLQSFNESYTLFSTRPLPVNATTSVFYLYERGFPRGEFGYASSLAWLLFIVIFTITLIQFRLQRSEAYDS